MKLLLTLTLSCLVSSTVYASLTCSSYSDRPTVKSYTHNLYEVLNIHLRGIEEDASCEDLLPDLLSDYFTYPTTQDVVYRGSGHFSSLDHLKKGDCFLDKGFLSASKSPKIAYGFTSKDNPIIFEINSKTGKELGASSYNGKSYNSSEDEILFKPNSYFKVIDIYSSRSIFKTYRYRGFKEKEQPVIFFILDETTEENCISIHY